MSKAIRIVLLAAGAIVFVAIVRRIGTAEIAGLLRRAGWAVAIVSAIYAVHVGVRAFALWRCIASGPGTEVCGACVETPRAIAFREVLKIRFAGEGIEMLTFTGPFLAEPAKAWLLNREGLRAADALGAVAIEYVLYTMMSAWMAAASLVLLLQQHALPAAMRRPLLAVVAGIAAITAGFLYAAISGRGLLVPTGRAILGVVAPRRAGAIVERVADVEQVLLAFIHRRPARLMALLAIEAAGHALLASEVWVVMRAIAEPVTVLATVAFEGGVKFISVVFFFIPGQVGAQEGVYALLAQAIGRTAAAGLTLALVRRIRALLVAGVGVGVLSTMRATTRAARQR